MPEAEEPGPSKLFPFRTEHTAFPQGEHGRRAVVQAEQLTLCRRAPLIFPVWW